MPRKKTSAAKPERSGGNGKPNKSAFVRSLPNETSAKEVIEKAKALGMKLTPAYIYSVRTAAKVNARKRGGSTEPPRRGRPPKSASSVGDSGNRRIEDLLRAAAAELGLSRAIGLLQAEQQRVRAALGD
jgi:hypothetical protein